MLDFVQVVCSPSAKNKKVLEIYPKFMIVNSSDLMIRGGDFYAIWDEESKLWRKDEQAALDLIDRELVNFYQTHKDEYEAPVKIQHMWDADTGMIDKWHKYVQRQSRDKFHPLDEKLIFSNTETSKSDYASQRLRYPLEASPIPAYEELVSTLYSEEERKKLEWAIGAIVSGDSKSIQKFVVLYGSAGTGKSTVLNIIQSLFDGYYTVFDAKALGSTSDTFALEPFKANPLVGIQHDGDLSRIEDNTRLNSLVSHETMTINEKFRSLYATKLNTFLFMGTNKPVRITDAKSGIIRRLIDISPTGNKIPNDRYKHLTSQVQFELGGIASHCLEVYQKDPKAYDNYIPVAMIGASNDFYNFVLDSFDIFAEQKDVQLKSAYDLYKVYCADANVAYPFNLRVFKEELKNYFEDFKERHTLEDGTRIRNYYIGFLEKKFVYDLKKEEEPKKKKETWLKFDSDTSRFDIEYADCPAQYSSQTGIPKVKWDDVKTTLKDINTSRLHYVRVDQNHIVIDFDIKDETGNKSFEKNLEAASMWPKTYAELSKSGSGIHLHYIYSGDITELSNLYSDEIEIKIFTGKSSLRRKLTKCCDLPIATINSGLPLKGASKKVVNFDSVQSEKGLRTLITRHLNKEINPNTKPSVDFIYSILEKAYNSGLKYDVTDMRPAILAFANGSTHQSDYCIKLVMKMKFKSDDISEPETNDEVPIVFWDVEVFPNLFLVNWKYRGPENKVVRMINPSPTDVEKLFHYRLIGFNNRRYDNHILYARYMGYTNAQLFNLSQRIIAGSDNCFFGEAYNLSYTDIYDFCSKKQSLKKWEIELGIHHQELGLPWDEPVPKELWTKVAEYCDNDVLATEAVFEARQGDWVARQILADVAGMTVNDTTNSLTTRIIFGKERHPELVYTQLEKEFPGYEYTKLEDGKFHNMYRGEDVGFGGYVYAEPGMYENTITFDVASMHPSSIIAMNCFGKYTSRFKDILDTRILIKHKDFDKAKKMLGGALAKYLDNSDQAKALAQALKIAINSVYGLTSAKFDNPFRDSRNVNNIVALRGALFMVNLKHEIQDRGFTVAHIKTDSIKIVKPTKEIFDFVMDYGHKYGYNFEIEHIFEKICLINDAVYIAKVSEEDEDWQDDAKKASDKGEPLPTRWTATGAQFAVPYVFKTLFSHEDLVFEDMCETKTVTSALYLDMNEGREEDYHDYQFVGKAGQFCPIKPGCGGGILLREKDGKYSSATGAKGYRWLESEVVKNLGKEDDIDINYYEYLAGDAKLAISEFGDFDRFVK